MSELLEKLHTHFAGKIVRKDLTKKIKEGANVPVYVLEYLLGMYCSSRNEDEIEAGIQNVKHILAENFVRPDEAQKIISKVREQGSYTVNDKVSVVYRYFYSGCFHSLIFFEFIGEVLVKIFALSAFWFWFFLLEGYEVF